MSTHAVACAVVGSGPSGNQADWQGALRSFGQRAWPGIMVCPTDHIIMVAGSVLLWRGKALLLFNVRSTHIKLQVKSVMRAHMPLSGLRAAVDVQMLKWVEE